MKTVLAQNKIKQYFIKISRLCDGELRETSAAWN